MTDHFELMRCCPQFPRRGSLVALMVLILSAGVAGHLLIPIKTSHTDHNATDHNSMDYNSTDYNSTHYNSTDYNLTTTEYPGVEPSTTNYTTV